jgi:hypothetical protein
MPFAFTFKQPFPSPGVEQSVACDDAFSAKG